MAKLIATSPCAGLLPLTIGSISIVEQDVGQITLVAPYQGQQKAVSEALKSSLGVAFPAPNRAIGTGPRTVWCGMRQALVMGAACPDLPAACVDHSDAWAVVRIDGADTRSILARLTPVDLRAEQFKRGHTARTLIGHMTATLTCIGAHTFEIMVMRSMAATVVHELEQAATHITHRAVPSI